MKKSRARYHNARSLCTSFEMRLSSKEIGRCLDRHRRNHPLLRIAPVMCASEIGPADFVSADWVAYCFDHGVMIPRIGLKIRPHRHLTLAWLIDLSKAASPSMISSKVGIDPKSIPLMAR